MSKAEAKTREEYKKLKQMEKEKETENDKEEAPKRVKARLVPIWLRFVIVLVLLIIFLAAGAMVGYGVLGGKNPFDVFKASTWTHISDLVNKK